MAKRKFYAISITLVVLALSVIYLLFILVPSPPPPPLITCSVNGDMELIETNTTEDSMIFSIVNLDFHGESYKIPWSLDPWSKGPWSNESKTQTYPVIVEKSDGGREYNYNWTYVDKDGDGFITEGDEIVLYNASNYEKGCRITLGTNVYPDKEGIDASGCDLIVLVIEVRI